VKLLILSFYYEPDLCAGSFRTTALVRALRETAPPGTQIHVLTTLPNRYQSFSREAAQLQEEPGLRIDRVALPAHNSDMRAQSRAFLTFAGKVLKIVRHERYDLVFATSSRLMTAVLGSWVARRKNTPLYLDIRDIFAETIAEVLRGPFATLIGSACALVERWTVMRATRINLVSRGFESYFQQRYANLSLANFTNGIDEEFLRVRAPRGAADASKSDPRKLVLYAGNLGDGQALHEVLPQMAHSLRAVARFVIVGDGGRRRALADAVAGAENVELRDPVSRADLIEAYAEADVLFLHLGKLPAFERVLPSKIFEYAASGKPILAGVGGYAARFIGEEIDNAAVFAPCDARGAVDAFYRLDFQDRVRNEFIDKYARQNIMRNMARDVIRFGGVTE
jgi:glycosyltransferase involved in cell wall biosynthesis